jgi:hypothetical protein
MLSQLFCVVKGRGTYHHTEDTRGVRGIELGQDLGVALCGNEYKER